MAQLGQKIRCVAEGRSSEFADTLFHQVEGFGEYGFPASHAASFALITYMSCWLKWHEPACYLVAMLNSQPMGFYGPSQLVQDAQRHGVVVLPVDMLHSNWDCTLVTSDTANGGASQKREPQPVVRLGLRLVSGFPEEAATRIMCARAQTPFTSTEDLALRATLDAGDLTALASADALASLSGHRRQQVWDASALHRAPELLREAPFNETLLVLPPASEGEEVRFDYASVGLTLRSHPTYLLRQ
jgi:error-prone DNA polymerase